MIFFKRQRSEHARGNANHAERLDPQRLDMRLLQNGAIALYHKNPVLSEDAAWFESAGYTSYVLDAARWITPADFHGEAKRVLGFPDYYAGNLAAWIDCLGDLAIPDDGGVVIQLRHFDAFARAQPQLAQTILDSIESTSRKALIFGRRLLALVQSDDPRVRFERVGALPVTWNPREWLDSDRGLRPAS
jgi:RNAse (barnase) inhibitor barstar